METGIFYILAAIILTSALMVVSLRNIFHSALMLILCFFAVAGLYVTLDADFLAAVQVLIYVGAVTILMIFAQSPSNFLNNSFVTNQKSMLPHLNYAIRNNLMVIYIGYLRVNYS